MPTAEAAAGANLVVTAFLCVPFLGMALLGYFTLRKRKRD